MRLAYYTPSVVDGPNTTPYRHARALGEHVPGSLLLTGRPPPRPVAEAYQEVRILDGTGYTGILANAMRARRLVDRRVGPEGVLVTGVGHGPTLAGALGAPTWVADVFDDPTQFVAENPDSTAHELLTPVVLRLLERARFAYITQHPSSPLRSGRTREYGFNGAPVTEMAPGEKPPRSPLRAVVAGKAELRHGLDLFLDGLDRTDAAVYVDVFGEPYADSADYADALGLSEQVEFHGWVDAYETVRTHVQQAHVGVCLWPERRDWDYSYPLKVGEYMAGGAIPMTTPRPGMVDLAGDAGVCCASATEVARTLERLADLSAPAFDRRVTAVRKRAEVVPQERDTRRFLRAVDSCLDSTTRW